MNKLFKLLEGNGLLILAWILAITWLVYSISLVGGRTITTELDLEAYDGIWVSNMFLFALLINITMVNIFTEKIEERKERAEITFYTIMSMLWTIMLFARFYVNIGYDWFHAIGSAARIVTILFIFVAMFVLFPRLIDPIKYKRRPI
jgi:hypothetical protein